MKRQQYSEHKQVDDLYHEAREVIDSAPDDAFVDLRRAVSEFEAFAGEQFEDKVQDAVAEAREKYCECRADDIEISDPGFHHHNGNGGYWIAAWLWVPDGSEEDDE